MATGGGLALLSVPTADMVLEADYRDWITLLKPRDRHSLFSQGQSD